MNEEEMVNNLGKSIGFGRVMQLCEILWKKCLRENSGGEFTVGPCRAFMVKCECKSPAKCDWCCGTGLLTEKVKLVKSKFKE